MNCPACGYFNPEGSKSCFHCSLVLPLPAGDAVCPVHPEVKASGACSRFGTFGCSTCLVQVGPDWLCPTCRERQTLLPWDERASLGLWRAWWKTSVLMITSPMQSLARARADAPVGDSMLFSLLATIAGIGPTIVFYMAVFIPVMLFAAPARSGSFGKGEAAVIAAIFAVYAVSGFLFALISVLVMSGLDHLGLMLVGANPKSFTVTLRAHALSMGPYVLGLVPFCSLYVFPLWALVLRVIANMELHKTTGGRATAGVLLPIVVLCGLGIAAYLAFFAAVLANLPR
ncbi:MAG: YIP1 family protein [Myxococcaceae bacterium]